MKPSVLSLYYESNGASRYVNAGRSDEASRSTMGNGNINSQKLVFFHCDMNLMRYLIH